MYISKLNEKNNKPHGGWVGGGEVRNVLSQQQKTKTKTFVCMYHTHIVRQKLNGPAFPNLKWFILRHPVAFAGDILSKITLWQVSKM